MTANPLHDPEREYRAATGKVLKRVDRCANHKRNGADADCPNDAREGHSFCCDECASDSFSRSERRHIGGRIVRVVEPFVWERPPIGGTRFPQENSRRGDGYE